MDSVGPSRNEQKEVEGNNRQYQAISSKKDKKGKLSELRKSITKSDVVWKNKTNSKENCGKTVQNEQEHATKSKIIKCEFKEDSDNDCKLEAGEVKGRHSKNTCKRRTSEDVVNVMQSYKGDENDDGDEHESKAFVMTLDSEDSGKEESDLEFEIVKLKHTIIERKSINEISNESEMKKHKLDTEKKSGIRGKSKYVSNAAKSHVKDEKSELQFRIIKVGHERNNTKVSKSGPTLITMESSEVEEKENKSDQEKIVLIPKQSGQENQLNSAMTLLESKGTDDEGSELECTVIKLEPAKRKAKGRASEPIVITTESDDDEVMYIKSFKEKISRKRIYRNTL